MNQVDLNDVLGLIDSGKGEIMCKDCLKDEDLSHIPEEEVITKDKMQSGDTYFCDHCKKQL